MSPLLKRLTHANFYKSRLCPRVIGVGRPKTGEQVLHPLEAVIDGERVQFYPEAEAVLKHLPQRGISMILKPRRDGAAEPYSAMQMSKVVVKIRTVIGLPKFTIDACRHGGMTELEEAGLTDGQGRALSAHRSRAYQGYAKRTEKRAIAATLKRHAHRLANDRGTEFRNERRNSFRNDPEEEQNGIA